MAESKWGDLKDKVKEFPKTPGVYIMKNAVEKIIYVGKAKSLRSRVQSYLNDSKDHSTKTKFLISQIKSIEFILTKTEVEAFLLEASLIKKHRPKYNIRLKDDKTYPYIRVSMKDEFPRLYLSRKVVRDGSVYFGPYTSGLAVHQTIKFLNQNFQIRDCRDAFMKSRTRPCITHQIGRCTAPCVKLISVKDYQADLKSAVLFLKGQDKAVVKELEKRMKLAASEEKFEQAAKLRDSFKSLQHILEKQMVIDVKSDLDQDAVGYFSSPEGTCIEVLHMRKGRVLGSRPTYLTELDLASPLEDVRDVLTSFVNQYYEENIVPDELWLPVDLGVELNKLLSDVLKERATHSVKVRFASSEKAKSLVEMAEKNAEAHFADYMTKSTSKKKGLEEIAKKLHLPELPLRIECYDISNFQGDESVASQVVFEEGVPSKDHYRRYKIKTVVGSNDFASMAEVMQRRFQHIEYDEPQLIVVDGGKGQLRAAHEVLKEMGKGDLPIVGLAKARVQGGFQDQEVKSSEERFYLPGRENPVVFHKSSAAYQILVGIRDEAHRFALNYHRKLRENSSLESALDLVVGLGEKRKQVLLKKFLSVEGIREASAEDISKLKGFNLVLAERVLLQLNEDDSND